MKHVFIIGSRGLPAKYGGFETFVEELIKHQQNQEIKYHVACRSENSAQAATLAHFDYLGADCFGIKTPNIGPARAIAYDMKAINESLKFIAQNQIEQPVFIILGNTIGGFIGHFAKKIHKVGGSLLVNPDGLEWKRSKWAGPIRKYFKLAEQKMVQKADYIVSDNQGIQDYLQAEYGEFKGSVIAYGTAQLRSDLTESKTLVKYKVSDYFLIVGRFVPENNYELIIRNFMQSPLAQDLVIVTNFEGSSYFDELKEKTHFDRDKRIKFVGTVYDQNELRFIREHAAVYLHGHEVGGTNPGLLEAMWSTPVNLVLDVTFNRTTAGDSVLYFGKENLTTQLEVSLMLSDEEKMKLHQKATARIEKDYTWQHICQQYEELFIGR